MIFLLLSQFFIPVLGIDTGELSENLDKIETDIPIEVKLWGYSDDSLINTLNSELPSQVIQESRYPVDQITGQWQTYIGGQYYGLVNNINYNLVNMDLTVTQQVKNQLNQSRIQHDTIQSPIGENITYSGFAFPHNNVSNLFEDYNSVNGYTIHLLNYSDINQVLDQNSTHWIKVGNTMHIRAETADIRNTVLVGDNGILFDSSAIAPFYGIDQNFVDNLSGESLHNYIQKSLIQIIENLIVGSPFSYNYIPIQSDFHFAAITIGESSSSSPYIISSLDSVSQDLFEEIRSIMPYFNILTSNIYFTWDRYFELNNLKNANTVVTDEEEIVVINDEMSESLKTLIRNNAYSEFPEGFYYALIMMDDNTTNYKLETETGLVNYETGYIGLALDDLDEFYPSSFVEVRDILSHKMRLYGLSLGFNELDGNVSSQVDSPMSIYGISSSWNEKFSTFEKDTVNRELSAMYRTYLTDQVDTINDLLDNSIFLWYPRSGLENIKTKVSRAEQLESNLNYVQAMYEYVEANELLEKVKNNINKLKNFVFNGFYLLLFVIILGYYVRILNDISYSKEEFKEKFEKAQSGKAKN